MTRATWVKMAFYAFTVAFAVGVYLNFGLGWALMAIGLIGAMAALLLHDVDEGKKDGAT